jgi:hypothetical protein
MPLAGGMTRPDPGLPPPTPSFLDSETMRAREMQGGRAALSALIAMPLADDASTLNGASPHARPEGGYVWDPGYVDTSGGAPAASPAAAAAAASGGAAGGGGGDWKAGDGNGAGARATVRAPAFGGGEHRVR